MQENRSAVDVAWSWRAMPGLSAILASDPGRHVTMLCYLRVMDAVYGAGLEDSVKEAVEEVGDA